MGSSHVEDLDIPSDLTTEALYQLAEDVFSVPAKSLCLIFKGTVLRVGGILASYNVNDQDVITVCRKNSSPVAEDPPVPSIPASTASQRTLRNLLNDFQLTLAETNSAASNLQSALLGSNVSTINAHLESLNRLMPNMIEKLTRFAEPAFENMQAFRRDANPSPQPEHQIPPQTQVQLPGTELIVFTADEWDEMARLSAMLPEYARENQLADTYRSSDLYTSLIN
jgi:hypothetical protein